MRHRLMTHPLFYIYYSSFFISITAPLSFSYQPHTPYKQPPEAWSLPLNPNHRKTRLLLIEKIAKFAEKY